MDFNFLPMASGAANPVAHPVAHHSLRVGGVSVLINSPLKMHHRFLGGRHVIDLTFHPEDLMPYHGLLEPYEIGPLEKHKSFVYPNLPTPGSGFMDDYEGQGPVVDRHHSHRTVIIIELVDQPEPLSEGEEAISPCPPAPILETTQLPLPEPTQLALPEPTPNPFTLRVGYMYSYGPAMDAWRLRLQHALGPLGCLCSCSDVNGISFLPSRSLRTRVWVARPKTRRVSPPASSSDHEDSDNENSG